MAERTGSADRYINWASGEVGRHFALHFKPVAFAQNLSLVDFASLYFMGAFALEVRPEALTSEHRQPDPHLIVAITHFPLSD